MLIKCPECGHQVSDKAPICPHCGIEISRHTAPAEKQELADDAVVVAEPVDEEPVEATPAPPTIPSGSYSSQTSPNQQQKAKKGNGTLIASFLIAAIICAVVLYFYKDAVSKRDADIKANIERVDSLEAANKGSEVVVAETTEDMVEPTTEESGAAEETVEDEQENKTDEETSAEQQTDEKENKQNAEPTAEEKKKAFMAVRHFFQAINAHSSAGIRANTTGKMTSFGTISNATSDDVISYMNSLYSEGVTNLNFHLGTVSGIEKKEHDGKTEYVISLPARKVTEHGNKKTETSHQVNATVTADGKVKAMSIH